MTTDKNMQQRSSYIVVKRPRMIRLELLLLFVGGATAKVLDPKPIWERFEEKEQQNEIAADSVLSKSRRKLNVNRRSSVLRWLNENLDVHNGRPPRLLAEDHYYRLDNAASDELQLAKPERRVLQSAGDRACEAEKGRLESLPEYNGFECTCDPTELGGVRLRCVPVCGEFCNDEGLICGKEQVVKIFQPSGNISGDRRGI